MVDIDSSIQSLWLMGGSRALVEQGVIAADHERVREDDTCEKSLLHALVMGSVINVIADHENNMSRNSGMAW